CRDDDTSWIDWTPSPRAEAMLRFTRELIRLRKRHPSLRRTRFIAPDARPGIRWYGEDGREPRWDDRGALVLCFTVDAIAADEADLHIMLNMSAEPRSLPLPAHARW